MDVFYDGTRHCKKCNRDLPNNSLYFPYDKTCKDGLRNVCRECNPKYKHFLEENHRTNTRWSEEDIIKLRKLYPHYTNQELITKFFHGRTIRSVEGIASKYGFSGKSEETLKRVWQENGIQSSVSQKGKVFSDEQKKHMSEAQILRYQRDDERQIARQNALKRGLGAVDTHPIHLNPLYGDKNGRWNGGASELIDQLRREISTWKKKSSAFCDYSCVITGDRFKNIHHVISFNFILEEVFIESGIDKRSKVMDYTNEEYSVLKQLLIGKHNDTLYGACLCKELHELFHKEYTYYNSSIEDFLDFIFRIENGFYDEYFEQHNLVKKINYTYINYLRNAII